jgi:hypothetical protein
VWTSHPGGPEYPGWDDLGVTDTQALWIKRYYACTQLATVGRLNVLMMDLDTIIYRDPYPDLHAPPHADVTLIHLKEGFANGGLFYLQRPALGGPALWVHGHVLWKANLIVRVEHEVHQHLGTLMDQALLNDNLNAAGCNSSALDMPSVYVTGDQAWDNPFWATKSAVFGKTAAELSVRKEGDRWYCDFTRSKTLYDFPDAAAAASIECTHADDAVCAEAWAKYRREQLTGKPLEFLELRIPLDADDPAPEPGALRAVERFAAGMPWTFGTCDAAHSGWRHTALIHLVACSADWSDEHLWTHVGRRALMVATGAWHLAAVLEPVTRFLTLSPALVVLHTATKNDFSRLLARLLAAAAATARMPVLPSFDCDVSWTEKNAAMRGGVFDKRVIKHRGLCYPAPSTQSCSHANVIGGYEFIALHAAGLAPGADVIEVEEFEGAAANEEVVAALAKMRADGGGGGAAQHLAHLRVVCPAYFEGGEA